MTPPIFAIAKKDITYCGEFGKIRPTFESLKSLSRSLRFKARASTNASNFL
jgi:hypothetical protein